jgi:hypothetical protein
MKESTPAMRRAKAFTRLLLTLANGGHLAERVAGKF